MIIAKNPTLEQNQTPTTLPLSFSYCFFLFFILVLDGKILTGNDLQMRKTTCSNSCRKWTCKNLVAILTQAYTSIDNFKIKSQILERWYRCEACKLISLERELSFPVRYNRWYGCLLGSPCPSMSLHWRAKAKGMQQQRGLERLQGV